MINLNRIHLSLFLSVLLGVLLSLALQAQEAYTFNEANQYENKSIGMQHQVKGLASEKGFVTYKPLTN